MTKSNGLRVDIMLNNLASVTPFNSQANLLNFAALNNLKTLIYLTYSTQLIHSFTGYICQKIVICEVMGSLTNTK